MKLQLKLIVSGGVAAPGAARRSARGSFAAASLFTSLHLISQQIRGNDCGGWYGNYWPANVPISI